MSATGRDREASASGRRRGGAAADEGTGREAPAGGRPEARATVAVEGPLDALTDAQRRLLLDRRPAQEADLRSRVAELVARVRERGDAALREMARRYDGVELDALEVPRARWARALEALAPDVRRGLELAARNLEAFHRAQIPGPVDLEPSPGIRLQWRTVPLARAGVYAPGGRAAYPSSVLMGVIPARAAGVDEVVVCSPPGPGGAPPTQVLAAAELAGADRLFALGGAGAVAALAFGTESVPATDAVVGPGNRWVTEAKRQVAAEVIIDSPAGPSELLVVADGNADPRLAAAELVAQAEHDPDAAVLLVTPSEELRAAVARALEDALRQAPREVVARAALETRGALLLSRDLDGALAFARAYAAEHLLLLVSDSRERMEESGVADTAGTVFLGAASSVVFGDYATGANHVLPTGGAARSFSGLSVLHFLRTVTVQELTPAAAAGLAEPVAALAAAEGLPGHAAAALARSER